MSGEEACKVGAFDHSVNLVLVILILRGDASGKVSLVGILMWQL